MADKIIDEVEIIEETDNTNKEVEPEVELRIEGTECAEFAAELRMVQSRKESVPDAVKETEDNNKELNTLYRYRKVTTQEEEQPKERGVKKKKIIKI